MKTLIESYRSFPGEHCGSVAMRGLLHHYCRLDLPEAAVFGLGSGAASVYLSGSGLNPTATLFGRTISMERDLAANLEIDYREQPEPDDACAWQLVRDEVLAGRPTMLSGDIFYLDYREFKVHFPGHRFVLVGFDDELQKAFIADRIRPEAESCSYGALATSRNPPEGVSTQNLWGRFHDTEVGRDLTAATKRAIAVCASSMLSDPAAGNGGASGLAPPAGSDVSVRSGIGAVRAFADDLQGWSGRADASWLASFNASCIEKFGNGGGNFRRLYSRFLAWAQALEPRLVPESAPALALEAADKWTAVSDSLFAASREGSDPGHWAAAARHARDVADLEERLFRALAEACA